MKLAGPPAMMEVLLLTNRPAPMIPPMDIIVKWRPFSERLSSYSGSDCADLFGWVIGYPFVNPALSFLPCFDVDARIAEFGYSRVVKQLHLPPHESRAMNIVFHHLWRSSAFSHRISSRRRWDLRSSPFPSPHSRTPSPVAAPRCPASTSVFIWVGGSVETSRCGCRKRA